MVRPINSLVLAAVLVLTGYSQAGDVSLGSKPDFTGTWEWAKKSPSDVKSHLLFVSQSGDEIKIVQTLEYEKDKFTKTITLFLDGRGERNVTSVRGEDFEIDSKSITTWKKNKLERRVTFKSPMFAGAQRFFVDVRETETYSLSKDGNILTIDVTSWHGTPFSTNLSPSLHKRTYRRKTIT